jgi:excisionase family DNA binding protein
MNSDATHDRTTNRSGLALIKEAADFLRLSRSKVYELMESGELPFVKIGRSRRVRWAHLEQFVLAHTQTR